MKEIEMIFPEYMQNFSCIGSACEFTCCNGEWRVFIDKKTYQKYRSHRGDPELKKLMDKHITRSRKMNNDFMYARLKIPIKGLCPFLDENHLCRIHAELGFEALSHVCIVYPRKYIRINKVAALSATLSCPEVSRVALLNPNGISFINGPMFMQSKLGFSTDRMPDVTQPYPSVVKYFFDILSTAISILQHREYSVDKRMIVLGVFTKKVYDLFSGKNNAHGKEELPKILDNFADESILNEYGRGVEKFGESHMAQLILLRNMSLGALGHKGHSNLFADFMASAITSLFGEDRQNDEIIHDYQENGLIKYSAYLEEKSYIIENYLVNTLYEQIYPLTEKPPRQGGNDMFLSYMELVTKYVIFRTTLIGLLMKGQEPTDEFIVNLVWVYAKTIHHTPAAINQAISEMKEKETYTLAGAALILNV